MKTLALFFLLSLTGAEAHGRLTNVGTGTTRIGSATRYEDSPVKGANTGQQWICRHGTKKTSQAELIPNGQLSLRWKFGAAHVGDCAVYLSYDVDKSRAQQAWFKIANLYDCRAQNKQNVNIDIPSWLPPGPAVLRWDWYALHVWPGVEFYSQCSDVTVKNTGQQAVMPKTYFVNSNTAYPPNGKTGKGYRNPFGNGDQSMTGPSCANGYAKNDCYRTAVGTKRNTIDGGSGSGGGGGGATSAPTPQPTTQPPNTQETTLQPECPNHVIIQGSTLGSIATEYTNKGYPITWQEICKFNEIENCDFIMTGEVIIIPVGKCKNALNPAPTTTTAASNAPGVSTSISTTTKQGGGNGATTKTSVVVAKDEGSFETVTIFVTGIGLMHMLM